MKISIIGSGNVGAMAAFMICEKELGDVVMVDITEGMPQGKALDILEAMPIYKSDSRIKGTNDFSEIKGSDIVVVTAGMPRKPGMTRSDLLRINAGIIRSVALEIRNNANNAIVIVVTNPLDAMAYLMYKETGFHKRKVMGLSGALDSTRFRSFIAEAFDVSVNDVSARVIGSHAESMVPLISQTLVKGKPIAELLDEDDINKLVERTRNAGAEIVEHLKTGSAFFAPAAAIVEMIESIIKDDSKILPCSAYLDGEYGFKGIFMGVPVKLYDKGIKEIVELDLTEEENALLKKSAHDIEKVIKDIK